MQSNEYISAYDDYNDYQHQGDGIDDAGMLIIDESSGLQGHGPASSSGNMMEGADEGGLMGLENGNSAGIDFNDPKIASLPRILLMGPRRGGKTSIQVGETLFCVFIRFHRFFRKETKNILFVSLSSSINIVHTLQRLRFVCFELPFLPTTT